MATLSGGEKFVKAMAEIAKKLQNKSLRVGFLEKAKYPDGTSVALVAATNEFGRKIKTKVGIKMQPPRPFFRNMIAEKQGEWPQAIANLLKKNNYDAKKTLELTGHAIKGQLQESITKLTSPPLAPSTIKAKGHSKPLIATGHMLNSVDYEVVDQK